MKYEYKVIPVVQDDEVMTSSDLDAVQKWFDDGWEYVDSITQPLSTGSSCTRISCVGIILKKEKTEEIKL